ncbi:hypothetical protein [Nonomuraea sp. B5E05]
MVHVAGSAPRSRRVFRGPAWVPEHGLIGAGGSAVVLRARGG